MTQHAGKCFKTRTSLDSLVQGSCSILFSVSSAIAD